VVDVPKYLGPTEVRVILIGLNTLALVRGPIPFGVSGVGATITFFPPIDGAGRLDVSLHSRQARFPFLDASFRSVPLNP